MLDTLLQLDVLQKILMNTLLVSIPEEFYLVMFTLILVGEFDYWKEDECKRLINKFDYVRVFLPTIISALLSNILRYTDLNSSIYQLMLAIILYIIIVLTNDIFGDASALKWMAKAFIFYLIGHLTLGLSELVYTPFVLYGANITMEEINNNILLNFLLSLPSRLLLYSVLLYFVSNKRTLLKGRLLKPIISNRILTIIFSALVLFNIIFLWMMYKAIVYDNLLVNTSHFSQILIVLGVVFFPISNVLGLLWGFYYLKDKEINNNKIANEKLHILLKEIELFSNNDNYGNIKWKLNEIGMGIEEVADIIYKENGTVKIK